MTLAQTSTPLGHVPVGDAMHPGILAVPADVSLPFLARTMAVQRVHSVALLDGAGHTSLDIVDDLALIRAITTGAPKPVPVTMPVVDAGDSVQAAAGQMVRRAARHLLVTGGAWGVPLGVISSFDVVSVIGRRDPRVSRRVRPAPARPALSENRLERVRVGDAMHAGVVGTSPYATIEDAARLMADHRVHFLVVAGLHHEPGQPRRLELKVVTALALISGAIHVDARLGDLGSIPPVTVGKDDTMADAAAAMVDRGVDHLVVCDDAGRPTGVLSTLDVADVYAVE